MLPLTGRAVNSAAASSGDTLGFQCIGCGFRLEKTRLTQHV